MNAASSSSLNPYRDRARTSQKIRSATGSEAISPMFAGSTVHAATSAAIALPMITATTVEHRTTHLLTTTSYTQRSPDG